MLFFFTDGCSCFPGWKGEKCNEGWYKGSEKELKEELKGIFFNAVFVKQRHLSLSFIISILPNSLQYL